MIAFFSVQSYSTDPPTPFVATLSPVGGPFERVISRRTAVTLRQKTNVTSSPTIHTHAASSGLHKDNSEAIHCRIRENSFAR
jgi:hypothetical protein